MSGGGSEVARGNGMPVLGREELEAGLGEPGKHERGLRCVSEGTYVRDLAFL